MLQTLEIDTDKTRIYSVNLDLICEMEKATINNEKEYVKIYNDSVTKYFDKDGNEVSENSDLIKDAMKRSFPDEIKDYKKVQESLDDIYYE